MIGLNLMTALLASSLLLFESTSAFLLNSNAEPRRTVPSSVPLHESQNSPSEPTLQVALLLPSSPENLLLQDSAHQIVSQLQSSSAVVVICNSPEADQACQNANLLMVLGVDSPLDVRFVATAFRLRRAAQEQTLSQLALGGKPFAPLIGAYDEANPPSWPVLPWTAVGQDQKLWRQMQVLLEEGGEVEDYAQAIELYLKAKG